MADITTTEAAKILESTREWIAYLCRAGILKAKKPGGRDWFVELESVKEYRAAMDRGEIKARGRKKRNDVTK